MKCPNCGFEESKVVDSRPTEQASIRRRRECLQCKKRFTTYEIIDTVPPVVVKKDNSREIFDRNKILTGLRKSCYKRGVNDADLQKIAADIEMELRNSLRTEFPSSEIGTMVMERLKQLDEVSYVRFASVYREFKDIDTFMEELRKLCTKQK